MGLFKRDDGALQQERRAAVRAKVDCPAQLRMTSGDRPAHMSDLSEGGARLRLPNPPQEGVSAFLSWGAHEYFCKVIWTSEDGCGVAFERPIPVSIVNETSGQVLVTTGPSANPGNIPLGRKRSRPQMTG